MSFLNELWRFMRTRKKFWLLPIFVVLGLFGAVLVLTQGSAVAPCSRSRMAWSDQMRILGISAVSSLDAGHKTDELRVQSRSGSFLRMTCGIVLAVAAFEMNNAYRFGLRRFPKACAEAFTRAETYRMQIRTPSAKTLAQFGERLCRTPAMAPKPRAALDADALNKLIKLLSAKQKRQALAVFGLMLLAAVFEFLERHPILPFVSVLAQPNIMLSNRYLSALKDASGLTTVTEFTIMFGLITAFVIWTSMLVRACNIYFISRFGFSVMHALSLDMMRLNLARDYVFYLKQNTADLTKTVLVGAEESVRGVLFPIMRVVLHAIISVFLMVLLLLINPLVAIVTSLALAACIAGIYLTFRRTALAAGRKRARADTTRFRHAHEVFGGFKELRLLGRESSYSRRFATSSLEHANATTRGETVATRPDVFRASRGDQRRHRRTSVSRQVPWRSERCTSISCCICLRCLSIDAVAPIPHS